MSGKGTGLTQLRQQLAGKAEGRLTTARDRQAFKIVSAGFFDWSERVPEPKAGPLDFPEHPYQRDLYAEPFWREVVVKKATQVGISAYLIRWCLYLSDTRGWTLLYVFPKAKQMYDHSDLRVKPLLASPYLRSRVSRRDVQNKGLMHVGYGHIVLRGSESKSMLDAVDADGIAFDEYDELTQENIPDAERRVSGSSHGLIRRVGVPSIPEFGVTAAYAASDCRRWLVKCGCGDWQPIDFWENVDQERMLVVCRKCRKPLDVATGQWVAEFPERSARGYHASRLIVPRVARNDNDALAGIVADSKKTKPYEITVFHNKDLAEDYAPAEGRLTEAALAAAQSAGGGYLQVSGYAGVGLVTMGVDVASTRNLNVRISEHLGEGVKRALFIGEVGSFNEVVDKMREYRVNMACIDHLPERRLAMGVVNRFPGMVYLVNYSAPQVGDPMVVNEPARTVSVRRTEAIDAMMAVVREQRNHLPLDLPEGYSAQMRSLVRHTTVDENDRVVVGYKKTGPDDYAQAEVYDLVATEMWLYRQRVDANLQQELRPLDELLEFERSALSDPNVGYSPGPSVGGPSMNGSIDGDEY